MFLIYKVFSCRIPLSFSGFLKKKKEIYSEKGEKKDLKGRIKRKQLDEKEGF